MLTSASRRSTLLFPILCTRAVRPSLGGWGRLRHYNTNFDPYSVLGVSRGASADEIKRQYRELAKRYHPDRNGGDDSRFKDVQRAYEVLTKGGSDPSSRHQHPEETADWSEHPFRYQGDPFQYYYTTAQRRSGEGVDPNTGYYVRWQTSSGPFSTFFYTVSSSSPGGRSHEGGRGGGSTASSANSGEDGWYRQFFSQKQHQQAREQQQQNTWRNPWTSSASSSGGGASAAFADGNSNWGFHSSNQHPFFTNWWSQFGLGERDFARFEQLYRQFRRRQLIAQFAVAFFLGCLIVFPFWCLYWFLRICLAIMTGIWNLLYPPLPTSSAKSQSA